VYNGFGTGAGSAVCGADAASGVARLLPKQACGWTVEAGGSGADIRYGDLAGVGAGEAYGANVLGRCFAGFCCWRLQDGSWVDGR